MLDLDPASTAIGFIAGFAFLTLLIVFLVVTSPRGGR